MIGYASASSRYRRILLAAPSLDRLAEVASRAAAEPRAQEPVAERRIVEAERGQLGASAGGSLGCRRRPWARRTANRSRAPSHRGPRRRDPVQPARDVCSAPFTTSSTGGHVVPRLSALNHLVGEHVRRVKHIVHRGPPILDPPRGPVPRQSEPKASGSRGATGLVFRRTNGPGGSLRWRGSPWKAWRRPTRTEPRPSRRSISRSRTGVSWCWSDRRVAARPRS